MREQSIVTVKRAGLYGRYSSDLQNERSIDDQFALARDYCARNDLRPVAEFSDRAMSGASLHGRAGVAALLAGAARGDFDVVVVEALDRLSRDMGDLSGIWKQLQFAGIPLIAVHGGETDQVQVGVRGLVGALYLTDLAQKTWRGGAGNIRTGKRASGLPYGYRPIPGKPGEHEIRDEHAAVVRRIFAEYAGGKTPRQIAGALNAEAIAPPRGRAWNASTIGGNAKRSAGILANHVYGGEIVWNKVGKAKNPLTGKRVPRIKPESEWHRAPAEHLRIVDEALWTAVQARRAGRSGSRWTATRPARRLLSGLMKCSACGSSIVASSSKKGKPYGMCTRHRESGSCTMGMQFRLDTIEAAVCQGLLEHLAHPTQITAALTAYHDEMRRLAIETAGTRIKDERRLGELRRGIARLLDGIVSGALTASAVGAKMQAMEDEATALEQRLAQHHEATVVSLHPAALARYREAIEDLTTHLTSGNNEAGLRIVRQLIDSVVVYPRTPEDKAIRFDLKGRLVALLDPRSAGLVVPGDSVGRESRGPTFLIPLALAA